VNSYVRLILILRLFTALLPAAIVCGCYPPATVPLDIIRYDAGKEKDPRLLLVFLPGNGDPVSVFQENGFVEAVRERGLAADMIAVNAHIGYYRNGSIFERLREDVIGPAKAKGYAQIWMIGNSLGGYGSISYARGYPDDITGVILLGPFLGDKAMFQEIEQAGGLQKWRPSHNNSSPKKDWGKFLWLWLKDHAQQERLSGHNGGFPWIYLGYGRDDRFSYGQSFMASFMPPEHVIAIDGGHDWSTWKTLWTRFLDQNIFGP